MLAAAVAVVATLAVRQRTRALHANNANVLNRHLPHGSADSIAHWKLTATQDLRRQQQVDNRPRLTFNVTAGDPPLYVDHPCTDLFANNLSRECALIFAVSTRVWLAQSIHSSSQLSDDGPCPASFQPRSVCERVPTISA
jgi:hypothetical protein